MINSLCVIFEIWTFVNNCMKIILMIVLCILIWKKNNFPYVVIEFPAIKKVDMATPDLIYSKFVYLDNLI
jgi:hypothetical protein